MAYIDNNLMVGEEVVYRAKHHWIIFQWPIFLLSVGLVISLVAGEFSYLIMGVVLAILTSIPSLIVFKTSEFGVTNKRVIVKIGWIQRHSLETLLTKVEGIQVNQEILGRILNYGSITISGTGGSREPFHKIAAPLEFRRKVQEQIVAVQDSK